MKAVKSFQNEDERLKLVKRFHRINSESTSYLFSKEAHKYVAKLEMSLILQSEECSISYKKHEQKVQSNE